MDNETVKHLWALRNVNEALLEGLKLAIFVLKNKDDLSEQRRKSLAESLKGLVSQSQIIYGQAPTKH